MIYIGDHRNIYYIITIHHHHPPPIHRSDKIMNMKCLTSNNIRKLFATHCVLLLCSSTHTNTYINNEAYFNRAYARLFFTLIQNNPLFFYFWFVSVTFSLSLSLTLFVLFFFFFAFSVTRSFHSLISSLRCVYICVFPFILFHPQNLETECANYYIVFMFNVCRVL